MKNIILLFVLALSMSAISQVTVKLSILINKDTQLITQPGCIIEIRPYKDPNAPPPVANQLPQARAGADITTSANTVTLNGSGSKDPDGSIVEYLWSQETGNTLQLISVNTACNVSGLVAGGSYRFRLIVKDNRGASATDTVHVTVTGAVVPPPPTANKPPTANAGANITITLPINTASLNGIGTDPDGTISSYVWTRVGGPTSFTITGTSTTGVTISNLIQGVYTFKLTVTDNKGATGSDDVNITVNSAASPPPPPTAGYTLTYQNNFSTTDDLDPQDHGQAGFGYIDNGWFRSRPDDISSGIRSEVQLDNNMLPLEGAVEYKVEYIYVVQNQCHSFQIHGSTGGSSAILAGWHVNGNLTVRINNGGPNISQQQPTQKIQTGRVYQMRLEYKIGSSGYYRWFIDGQQYANYTGPIQNGNSQWIKLGFNGGFDGNKTEAKKSDIKYDEWRIYKKS